MFSSPQKSKPHGFSLLEALVSMALLMLLMLLFLQLGKRTTSLWHQREQQQESISEARAALQLITSDLRSLLFLKNHSLGFLDGLLIIPNLHDASSTQLFFLATLPPEKRPPGLRGDLVTLGYLLVPNQQTSKKTIFDLYRLLLPNQASLATLQEISQHPLSQAMEQNKKTCCEKIASDITRFQATPVWFDHGTFSKHPFPKQPSNTPPAVISLSIAVHCSSPKKILQKERTFTTTLKL